MKFTKEEAFEKLKGFLTNNGKKTLRMSEKSVTKQLETLIPLIANDEMELDDFIDKVKETFSIMNSNVEKDNSDFIKDWEKNHPEPKKGPEPKSDPKLKNEPNDKMEKLMERLEELERKETEREHEKTISQKREDLLNAMKGKGIKDDQWIKDFINEIAITDDFDVESKADAYLKIYNRGKAKTTHSTPGASGGDSGDKEDLLDGARKLMKQRRENLERITNTNFNDGK